MTKKQFIRFKILEKLRNQKEEIRLHKSKIIKEKLFRLEEYRKAKTILFYMSFDGEVQTKEMIKESLRKGKTVLLPVCKTKQVKIIPSRIWGLKKSDFCLGPHRIPQPRKMNKFSIKDIDLVITPAVAFDKKGGRLGRGKGYYDRFLKNISAKTRSVGLAFHFQIVKKVPRLSSFDLTVDRVVFA